LVEAATDPELEFAAAVEFDDDVSLLVLVLPANPEPTERVSAKRPRAPLIRAPRIVLFILVPHDSTPQITHEIVIVRQPNSSVQVNQIQSSVTCGDNATPAKALK
jgi:hypothetical protein